MRGHQISQISREIPENMVFIPEALPPYFSQPPVHKRHESRYDEQKYEKLFFLFAGLFQPRGYDRDEQVKAEKWEHEPQVPSERRKVQRYPCKVPET
jgi:hypothetical protein